MKGQALVEFAIVTPVMLLIILGGVSVGLLLLNRTELQHAAQEAAVSGAMEGGCAGALGVVPQILGYEPDEKSCDETGQIVEVTLTNEVSRISPLPLPDSITVSARAMLRESPAPEPSG